MSEEDNGNQTKRFAVVPKGTGGVFHREPARIRRATVTFEPGARTAWHTLGQTLIVTMGLGLAQRWGGPIEEIRPGDVV